MNSPAVQSKTHRIYNTPRPPIRTTGIEESLRASRLFCGITIEQGRRLAELAIVRRVQQNEPIFAQGQVATKLMMIESGCVKFTQTGSSGRQMIIWIRRSGEMLGNASLLAEVRHSCTATAIEKCRIIVWDSSVLRNHDEIHALVSRNAGAMLSDRLQDLEERFFAFATSRVSQRIAIAVLNAAKTLGNRTRNGVKVHLSQKELALMCGTNIFSISRWMVKWGASGIVSMGTRSFNVLDMEGLEAVSEGSINEDTEIDLVISSYRAISLAGVSEDVRAEA